MRGFVINVTNPEDKTYREMMMIPEMNMLVSLEDGVPKIQPIPKLSPDQVLIHEREADLLEVNVAELTDLQTKQRTVAGMIRVFLPHADPTPIPEPTPTEAGS